MVKPLPRLKLSGFNNLTKTLSFNIYDICYAKTPAEQKAYIKYIDEEYNSERLTQILVRVSDIIGANILNIAKQDYEPEGASVTILISEGPVNNGSQNHEQKDGAGITGENKNAHSGPEKESVVGHLDKSHLTVHTYPELHPHNGIASFRVDIDVSTCGVISPLKALNFLLEEFDPDVATLDYRVRGFTRKADGKKIFIDHKIHSIQDFMDKRFRRDYTLYDVNVYQENLFHTKMMLREFDLDRYLFTTRSHELSRRDQNTIARRLKRETLELFYGKAMS